MIGAAFKVNIDAIENREHASIGVIAVMLKNKKQALNESTFRYKHYYSQRSK